MYTVTKYLTNDNEAISQSASCFVSFYYIQMQIYCQSKELKLQNPALAWVSGKALEGPRDTFTRSCIE